MKRLLTIIIFISFMLIGFVSAPLDAGSLKPDYFECPKPNTKVAGERFGRWQARPSDYPHTGIMGRVESNIPWITECYEDAGYKIINITHTTNKKDIFTDEDYITIWFIKNENTK